MSDTTPATAERMRELLALLAPGERMQMACAMFTMARVCARAGIGEQQPDIDEGELRVLEVRRLYPDGLAVDRETLEARIRACRRDVPT